MKLLIKLENLDIKSLNISEYNQRKLVMKTSNVKGVLDLYSRILYSCLHKNYNLNQKFVIVDYGGGCGLFSLLAAELGICSVIYNDIYDVSCKDVEFLSNHLNIKLDYIVPGDVNELLSFLNNKSIIVNAIASYDVIEHIYDIELHFNQLAKFQKPKFRIVYASGANILNKNYVNRVTPVQIEAELKGTERKWGHKECSSLDSYLNIRKNIISAYDTTLTTEQVDKLAHLTRGLIKCDIEKSVDEYRETGKITHNITHPTNTCDPYTGSWCENLIDFNWLNDVISKAGFSVGIFPDYYLFCVFFNLTCSRKKLITKSINTLYCYLLTRLLGFKGMFLASHYIVFAEKSGD